MLCCCASGIRKICRDTARLCKWSLGDAQYSDGRHFVSLLLAMPGVCKMMHSIASVEVAGLVRIAACGER